MTGVNAADPQRPQRSSILGAERRRLILHRLRAGEGAQVADLARRFGVSQMTIRRDLASLAVEGKLTRIHGGAVDEADEPPFGVIAIERPEAKSRVGRAGASMVEDGQTIMLDVGTTTLAMARALHGREITVITSNLAIVDELVPDEGIELVLLGGAVRRNYRSLVGVLAEDALRQLSADICFLGASGIRHDDLAVMDTTMAEVPIKRGMIAAAGHSALLVDAQKFSMGGSLRVCGVDDIDVVVTDAGDDEPLLEPIMALGVRVLRA